MDTKTKPPRRPGDGSKLEGSGAKILVNEVHHWWPQALSELWADADGGVWQLRYDGSEHKSTPDKFGGINNAHALKLKGPWNGTIEPIFGFADTNLPRIVSSIVAHLSAGAVDATSAQERNRSVRPFPMTQEDCDAFAEGLASLVLRSPGFRNYIRSNTNVYRADFNMPDIGTRDSLIAMQIHQWYSTAVASFQKSHMALLYSRHHEFVLGEGYMNNVRGYSHTFSLRALIPLTPELAVICYSGSGMNPPAPVCSLSVTAEDVDSINELAQIYGKEFIYFRSQRPKIFDHFERNEFLVLEDHYANVVEGIVEAVRNTRLRR